MECEKGKKTEGERERERERERRVDLPFQILIFFNNLRTVRRGIRRMGGEGVRVRERERERERVRARE